MHDVQRIPGVIASQFMAVHGAMEAMTADLVDCAAKGDPKAMADLAAIEKTLQHFWVSITLLKNQNTLP